MTLKQVKHVTMSDLPEGLQDRIDQYRASDHEKAVAQLFFLIGMLKYTKDLSPLGEEALLHAANQVKDSLSIPEETLTGFCELLHEATEFANKNQSLPH